MRAVWLLAGLTVQEMVRRRLFVLSLVIALFFFLVSLMPTYFAEEEAFVRPTGERVPLAVMLAAFLGVPMLKFFGILQVIWLAAGAIAGEIDRGLLAVVLPKPVARWQVLVGKWLGINAVMAANLLFWTALGWLSLRLQTGHFHPTLFAAGAGSIAYTVVFSTLTLFFSTFCAAPLAGGLAMLCAAAAWPHALLRALGGNFDLPVLTWAGKVVRYVAPVNHLELWIERLLGPLNPALLNPAGFAFEVTLSPSLADLAYAAGYTLFFFAAAVVVFRRRDVGGG